MKQLRIVVYEVNDELEEETHYERAFFIEGWHITEKTFYSENTEQTILTLVMNSEPP